MPTYVGLYNFTDQGMRSVEDTSKRLTAFKSFAETKGVVVREVYWTLGSYDMVAICEIPNDETAMALMLALAKAGNIRPTSLRAFSQQEMDKILAKLG